MEKIVLRPEDYIVLQGGLKIENISEKNVIEVELSSYSVSLLKIGMKD